MNIKYFIFFTCLSLFSLDTHSQMGIGTNSPSTSAILDLTSTTKGFLIPRLTHGQILAISNPANGLMVWCSDCAQNGLIIYFNGIDWVQSSGISAPLYPPSAPLNPVATANYGQASIAFTAPLTDRGSAITNYTVTSSPDGIQSTGTSSPIIVTGLTSGTAYTFTVVATNAIGNSSPSIPSAAVTLFPSPAELTVSSENSSVVLQWSKVTSALDYKIEYKETSAANWIVIDDGTSLKNTFRINGLTNEISYGFRVSAISSSQTSPTAVKTATPSSITNTSYLNNILSTGQSLSVGYNGAPAISTTQPFSNLMLTNLPYSFTPLIEPSAYLSSSNSNWETMSSGLGNSLTNFAAPYPFRSIITMNGQSAQPYSFLKKGGINYNTSLSKIEASLNLAIALNTPFRVPAVTVIHGESDQENNVTATQYAGYLVEWQNDYNNDIKALTNQYDDVIMFTDQVSSPIAEPTVVLGQWIAARDNPSKIVLVTPKYILDYSDGAHLNNYSYRRLGEYYGKVMKKVLVDKQPWLPLSPSLITISGNVITAKFNVPVAPLEFDTTAVDFKANYGFEYYDSSNSATITSVTISAPDTVQITLSTTPTGLNKRLRYAYTTPSFSRPGAHIPGSARGNLRDSDTTPSYYQDANVPAAMGNLLRNWCITFDEPIN